MPLASQERVGGGLPIGACLADFGASIGRDWSCRARRLVAIGRDSVAIWRACARRLCRNRSQSVAIWRAGCVAIGRDSVAIWRACARRLCRNRSRFGVPVASIGCPKTRHKKARFTQLRESGCLASLFVACRYASANSSFKYMCKRSKRSVRSGASMVHRDANV